MASHQLTVPSLGGMTDLAVLHIAVKLGDVVNKDDTLIAIGSDLATLDIPAPMAGTVRSILLKVGDKVEQGSPMVVLDGDGSIGPVATEEKKPASPPPKPDSAPVQVSQAGESAPAKDDDIYAGPATRKLAREMGVDLANVAGSGPKNRVQKDDVKTFVKNRIENSPPRAALGIPAVPEIDFAQFGTVDIQPLTGLQKAIVANMQRAWLNVPHVTQWDDADITDLENFRDTLKSDMDRRGVKLSPLPFLFKAVAAALQAHPKFNASLHADGQRVVYKQYFHIGMAVDAPAGLMVPVLRDVDKKSVWELAAETAELAQKAKDRKLKPAEMQGACFTISSLGNIGGLGFTPIVNTPEVGILGVSKLTVKPVWNGSEFTPRKMLPLSLSYDHRAVNGGDAGRFFAMLNQLLGDIRRLVL